MPDRFFGTVSGLIAAALALGASASGADYRGAAAGWPTYANGTYAANYPANYGTGAYYVARPLTNVAYAPAAGTMYVPTRAAYANPTYFGAYGQSPTMYRPVSTAGYAPAGGGYYAPTTVGYAPTTANYAPANSYAVSPAGISSAGSEATAYFGQPTTLNYVPPRYAYRPTYAQVPVYMYRPVTVYQPGTGQPVTCLQASTCTTSMCQPQRTRCSSWWNPFTWFGNGSSRCGTSACGAAPTTAYCGTAACGQQPYYPTQPVAPLVIPAAPAPAVPANVIPTVPRGFIPQADPRVPPPPTVAPGTRTIITPAETRPSLAPGAGTFTPNPGTFSPSPGTFGAPPAGSVTPFPSQPVPPGGSFPTVPPAQPGTGFGTGSFGTGTNYAPATDPYSASMTPAATLSAPANESSGASHQAGPAHSVFGSGYREESGDGVIRAPGAKALPPSVRTVPDLDEPPTPRPVNSAPQLLDPRDKTAGRDRRWGVVPAQWPTKERTSGQLSQRPVAPRSAHETYDKNGPSNSPYASQPANTANYEDGGWKTAAGF